MINEKVLEEMALMVMRQTELSLDEAKNRLKENNYNYITVIKNEMGIEKKTDSSSVTINQKIYKEIRTLMDNSCKNYRLKQEYEQKKKEYIEKMQEQQRENNVKENKKIDYLQKEEKEELK